MLKLMLCCTLCLLEWEENRATASIHQNQSVKSRANSPKLINHANGVDDGLCSISAEFIDRLLLVKWLLHNPGPSAPRLRWIKSRRWCKRHSREPWGVREVARNVMKPGDWNPLPIIFPTVGSASHCGVQQAHQVQDQCKSKCYSSLPPSPLCSAPAPLYSGATRLPVPPPRCSSEDNVTLFILWNAALLWDVEKTH